MEFIKEFLRVVNIDSDSIIIDENVCMFVCMPLIYYYLILLYRLMNPNILTNDNK